MKSTVKQLIAALTMVLISAVAIQARNINVHGTVYKKNTNDPIGSVYIFDHDKHTMLGMTNEEGKYLVTVDDNGSLEFDILGYQTQIIPVFGQLNLDVEMAANVNELSEVLVQAKRVSTAIITEPTDLDVEGNYLRVRTRIRMPHEMFSSNRRLIVQPMIYNCTRKEINYLTPIVYDGWRYDLTQGRMYNFDKTQDPLNKYVEVKQTSGSEDDIIYITDSCYVDNPHDRFQMDLILSIEDYDRIAYEKSITIARGVVNPLRWLEGHLDGVYVEDRQFLPAADLQKRDAGGDINLTFEMGKSNLDLSLGDNEKELESLLSQLRIVEEDPNSMIRSISITGTASPEGSMQLNQQLAKKRIESAMTEIASRLQRKTRSTVKLNTDAIVEPWSKVVDMLRDDLLFEEAAQVQEILDNNSDDRQQSIAIAKLDCYDLIKENYLPRLRRVYYEYVSSRYRLLSDDEIEALYYRNSANMSRYDFWRLYTITDSLDLKKEIAKRALEVHPNFLVGANDYTVMMMANDGVADSSILAPLMKKAGERVPDEARGTLAAAYFNEGDFKAADSICRVLPNTPTFRRIHVYTKALNGRFREVIPELSQESVFTEVLLLLAVKANQQAYEKSKFLGGSAKEEYIKAIAANRVDDYINAIQHLENAFALDPSLKEVARNDGDIIDLLDEEDLNPSPEEENAESSDQEDQSETAPSTNPVND